jgi:hypothetical protein
MIMGVALQAVIFVSSCRVVAGDPVESASARLPQGVGQLPSAAEAEQLNVLLLPGVFGSKQIREVSVSTPWS